MQLPLVDLDKIRNKYKFEFVLVAKKFKKQFSESLKEFNLIFENDLFEIYEVKNKLNKK